AYGIKNPAGRFDQVVHDGIRGQSISRPAFFVGAITGPHQDSSTSDIARERHVEPPIADGKRSDRVDVQITRGAIDQPSTRFAAVARDGVSGDLSVTMMGTIVIRVEMGPSSREQVADVAMDLVDDGFGEKAAGDARLIRDQDDRNVRVIQGTNGGNRPG